MKLLEHLSKSQMFALGYETVTGEVRKVIYRGDNNFCVLSVRSEKGWLKVVGETRLGRKGRLYKFTGYEYKHEKYGRTFKALGVEKL